MATDAWKEKLDAYLDGELPSAQSAELSAHLRSCSSCSADALDRVLLKRSVAAAGKRYEPSSELRAKIAKITTATAKPHRESSWSWRILLAPALLVILLSVGVEWYVSRQNARRVRVYGELADLHVATLASANPVDVISTDKHTVKPWFEGKIPFTFNLPEVNGTDFVLVGGRVAYLAQTPGAELIYRLRKHEISVFIFPDREDELGRGSTEPHHAFSFTMDNWTMNGLHYFVVGDIGPEDAKALSKLFRDAG